EPPYRATLGELEWPRQAKGAGAASTTRQHVGQRDPPEVGIVVGVVYVAAVSREPDEVGRTLAQPATSGNQVTPFVPLLSTQEVDRRRSMPVRGHARDLHQGNLTRTCDRTPDVKAVAQVLPPVLRGWIRGHWLGGRIGRVEPADAELL